MKEKHTGFFYGSSTVKEFKEVYVFESCVDLLSFLTLVKKGFVPQPAAGSCFISLNGAATRYLEKVLLEHPTIERIHFCTDNDRAGQLAVTLFTSRTHSKLPVDYWNQYLVDGVRGAKDLKDWNELLQACCEDEKLPF